MKKLQLKIQDLTNPSILTHREIRNIMGGDSSGSSENCGIDCYVQVTGTTERAHTASCAAYDGTFQQLCESIYGITATYTNCECIVS